MIRPSTRRVAQLAVLSSAAILCAPLRTTEAQTRRNVDSLFSFIQRDEIIWVARDLERDPTRVNARNERGETPLHVAARLNKPAMVEILLARGAEVDARDEMRQQTPLFTWLDQDHNAGRSIEVPRLLLAAGADMYAPGTSNGASNTPLQRLGERLRGAWVDEEVRNDATILTSFELPTSFIRSDSAGGRALVELFQQHDAIGMARDGSAEVLAGLVRRVPKALAHRDRFGRTPLLLAAYYGRQDLVAFLIERGADPLAADAGGGTMLRACAYWNHAALAASLRQRYALTDDIFTTIEFGSAGELETWLDRRPLDLTAKDAFGMTPLHWSVRRGKIDRVQMLLTRGADPTVEDNGHWTALELAARFGDAEACRLLADAGKKAGATSAYLVSAIHFAALAPDSEAFEALRGAAPPEDVSFRGEALIAACRSGRTDLVSFVLEGTLDVPETSALSVAASRGNAEVVTMLLDRGANARGSDKFGGTPLYAAARKGHAHIVRLLLDRGAFVDQVAPGFDATPLRAAIERDDPVIVDMLLAAGADPIAPNRQGNAPVEYPTTDEVTRVLTRWCSKNNRE